MYYSSKWIKVDWHTLGQTLNFSCFWALMCAATSTIHTFTLRETSHLQADFTEETFDRHTQRPHVCVHFILECFVFKKKWNFSTECCPPDILYMQAPLHDPLGSTGGCCSHSMKQQVSHLLKEWLYALSVTLLFRIIDALEKIVCIMLMYCPLILTCTSLQCCTSARCTTPHSTATPLRMSACSVITCDFFWLLKHCSFSTCGLTGLI